MSVAFVGGGMGGWANIAKNVGNGFKYAALPYPVLKKGDIAKFGQLDSRFTSYNSAAITSKCKNPDIAARLLDYAYSPDGIKLYNYGIKDITYTMVDNKPTYTDYVINNPDKLSFSNILVNYARVGGSPTIQQSDYLKQYLTLP